jgi:integration host factor subunit beta
MPDSPNTTTKKELVQRIAEDTKLAKAVVKTVVQSFLNEVIRELASGNRLEFREFGVFEVKERQARSAQNPRTLERVDVPQKRVVRFKVGRLMREQVCDRLSPASGTAAPAAKVGKSAEPKQPPQPPRRSNSPF